MNIDSDNSRLRGLWRGKCKDTGAFAGVWVTGLYVRRWNKFWSRWSAYILRLDEQGMITGEFEVMPETLGACVGFCDIDETPIFEGDILKSGNNIYGVVNWNNGIAGFVLPINDDMYSNLRFIDVWQNKIKVAGNIYDNPELLEEDTKEEAPKLLWKDNSWKDEMRKAGLDEETIEFIDAAGNTDVANAATESLTRGQRQKAAGAKLGKDFV